MADEEQLYILQQGETPGMLGTKSGMHAWERPPGSRSLEGASRWPVRKIVDRRALTGRASARLLGATLPATFSPSPDSGLAIVKSK
jgi:hypothetical protein